jgi:SAM-dependent methyltransferase
VKDAASPRLELGVFLLSGALMTTELTATRIFSVIIWYHFAFFAISVALFGTGVAALVVHLTQARLEPSRTEHWLGCGALTLAVSIVVVDLALLTVTPNWFGENGVTFTHLTLKLFALFVLGAAPFFCGGFALSLAVLRHATRVHRLYFSDLFGAGLACLAVIPLLGWLGGPLALLAGAVFACAAAVAFVGRGAARRLGWIAGALGLGVVALVALNSRTGLFRVRTAKGMSLQKYKPEFNRWNSFSMVTVFPDLGFRGWGLAPRYKGPIPKQKTLVIDMNAMTTLTHFDGNFAHVRYALFDLSAFAYRLRPHARNVCVIGAGGGKDVLAALAAGARHVTAVEINPLIVNDVMRGRFRAFTGDLYDRKDVQVVVEDGRSFVRRTQQRFDVINLSMVDTSAATAAGAYALTENSLYTKNAFEDFLKALRPGGVLSVASLSLPGLAVGARLASIAREAVRARGGDPARSIAVIATPWARSPGGALYEVIVKPDGFNRGETFGIASQSLQLGFVPIYVPGHPLFQNLQEPGWIDDIVTAQDEAALERRMASWPEDVSATTDDHPFFFYQRRISDLGRALVTFDRPHLFGNGLAILAKVVLIALVLVGAFLLVPFVVGRRELGAGGGAPGWDLAYVSGLGLGFMFLEIALIMRLSLYLGHPTATLSVVLLVLLVMSGLGSRVLGRGGERAGTRLRVALAALVGYALVFTFALGGVLHATENWPAFGRSLLVALTLAPLGFLLGAPFPSGLRAVADRATTRIPWLWSVNSATSVLGSVFATLLALHVGVSATLATGAAFYAAVFALSFKVVPKAFGTG